jgi:hypothetical protein
MKKTADLQSILGDTRLHSERRELHVLRKAVISLFMLLCDAGRDWNSRSSPFTICG